MPTFSTPDPISVKLSIAAGDATITASDRVDTVVEVRPADASNDKDVKAAEQTRIEFSGNHLLVETPKRRAFSAKSGVIALTIDLPADSRFRGDLAYGTIRGKGRFGECTFNSAHGAIQLDETGDLRANAASGDVTVNHIAGSVDVKSAAGDVTLGLIDGAATVATASGHARLGEAKGDTRVSAASGGISVDCAHASVEAKTASGDVRLGEAIRGSAVLKTASGDIEVGIGKGTAAWLDVNSYSGTVDNSLAAADGPEQTDEKVKVRARTFSGDIVIRRAG